MAVHPHRCYNPLTGEWVLVSPQRTQRPWQGQVERVRSLLELSDDERSSLARLLKRLVQRYDRLFDTRFPYLMGLHQASHLHVHFYPPLLRSASVRKFMVGYALRAV